MAKYKAARSVQQEITAVLQVLDKLYPGHPLEVADREPFHTLVATMLSSRTKDPVTNAAMRRLWSQAQTPSQILLIPPPKLAELLKPVGFYQQKAQQLHGLCQLLLDRFDGQVPHTRDELMELPGVGRKVANLVLNICFDTAAICVDTHVHRISNRMGWVDTATPEQTEQALMVSAAQKYWAMLNRVLVNHGQQICHPTSPRCSICPVSTYCQRRNVIKYR